MQISGVYNLGPNGLPLVPQHQPRTFTPYAGAQMRYEPTEVDTKSLFTHTIVASPLNASAAAPAEPQLLEGLDTRYPEGFVLMEYDPAIHSGMPLVLLQEVSEPQAFATQPSETASSTPTNETESGQFEEYDNLVAKKLSLVQKQVRVMELAAESIARWVVDDDSRESQPARNFDVEQVVKLLSENKPDQAWKLLASLDLSSKSLDVEETELYLRTLLKLPNGSNQYRDKLKSALVNAAAHMAQQDVLKPTYNDPHGVKALKFITAYTNSCLIVGDYAPAAKAFKKVLEKHSKFDPVRFEFARLHLAMGDFASADEQLQAATTTGSIQNYAHYISMSLGKMPVKWNNILWNLEVDSIEDTLLGMIIDYDTKFSKLQELQKMSKELSALPNSPLKCMLELKIRLRCDLSRTMAKFAVNQDFVPAQSDVRLHAIYLKNLADQFFGELTDTNQKPGDGLNKSREVAIELYSEIIRLLKPAESSSPFDLVAPKALTEEESALLEDCWHKRALCLTFAAANPTVGDQIKGADDLYNLISKGKACAKLMSLSNGLALGDNAADMEKYVPSPDEMTVMWNLLSIFPEEIWEASEGLKPLHTTWKNLVANMSE